MADQNEYMYKDVFEFQEKYPTRMERENALSHMSEKEILHLARSTPNKQSGIYYARFAKEARVRDFFADKARHLQNEIDLEIEKIGGEDMLISREDLFHWVYHSREQVKNYRTICRMLEEGSQVVDMEKIMQDLQETMKKDQAAIDSLSRKKAEEDKAVERLQAEADLYRQALDILNR